MSSSVVIDANLAVFSVLKTPHSVAAARVMDHLAQRGYEPFAPGLWWYEVTSVIHRYRFAGIIPDGTAHKALELLTVSLGIQQVDVPGADCF